MFQKKIGGVSGEVVIVLQTRYIWLVDSKKFNAMAPVFQKTTELDRLRKLVNEGKEYTALKELAAVAEENKLRPEAEQLNKIKKNLQYLDNHLKANSIDPMFAQAKRSALVFDLLEMVDVFEEKKGLKITAKNKKDVHLVLDPSLGLNDAKKKALVKTLEKILGVSKDNIGIEEALTTRCHSIFFHEN